MAFIPDTHTDTAGNRQRFFHRSGNALPFLTMRQTTNTNPVNGRKHSSRRINESPSNVILPGFLASRLKFEFSLCY